MLPSTVASPAPTASIEWCQKVRSAANMTPAPQSGSAVAQRARARSGGARARRAAPARAAPTKQRKNAAVEGDTSASRTRIAEKAITKRAEHAGEDGPVGHSDRD